MKMKNISLLKEKYPRRYSAHIQKFRCHISMKLLEFKFAKCNSYE